MVGLAGLEPAGPKATVLQTGRLPITDYNPIMEGQEGLEPTETEVGDFTDRAATNYSIQPHIVIC